MKWAGGKSRLLPVLRERLAKLAVRTYAEPFAGGAALFFDLAAASPRGFERARLADQNHDLCACYRALRDDVDGVIEALRGYSYDRDLYYRTREVDATRLGDVERAARLLFLNRTCYNGLWRVNASGKFNVPFGNYQNPRILDEPSLRSASRALADVDVRAGDFEAAVDGLGAGDFVYFDPPYVPLSKTANFRGYASGGFSWAEQERLVAVMERLAAQGVKVMLSNADTKETRELYARFRVRVVSAPRVISRDAATRADVTELLVTSWERRGLERAKGAA